MNLVGDTCKILNSTHIINAGRDYNSFLAANKENPGLNKLLKEYCSLVRKSEISDFGINRIMEILHLAQYDDLLSQCISKIDESLEIIDEVNPKRLSIIDFISKVKATPKQKMTEELFSSLVQQIDLDSENLSSYIKFQQEKYNREVILSTPEVCIYLICWKPGQETTVHRHEYSFGNVLVYQGTLTAEECSQTHTLGQKSFKTTKRKYYLQDQWLSVSHNQVHLLGNYTERDLITLHFKYYLSNPVEKNFRTPDCTTRDSNPELYDYTSFAIA